MVFQMSAIPKPQAPASKTPLYDLAVKGFPSQSFPLLLWQGLVRQVEEENHDLKAELEMRLSRSARERLQELLRASFHYVTSARGGLRSGARDGDYKLLRAATYLNFAVMTTGSGQPRGDYISAEITAMVDAAMVEMQNIRPPLRRGDCEKLILAALANKPASP
jgi:hypothetical protein